MSVILLFVMINAVHISFKMQEAKPKRRRLGRFVYCFLLLLLIVIVFFFALNWGLIALEFSEVNKEPSAVGFMSEQKPKAELEVKSRKTPPPVLLSPISPLAMKQSVANVAQTSKTNPLLHQPSSPSQESNTNVYKWSLI